MAKGLAARPGDYDIAYRYFESFSPLPGEKCKAAFDSLPESEKVGWFRRAKRAFEAGLAQGREVWVRRVAAQYAVRPDSPPVVGPQGSADTGGGDPE